MAVFTMPNKIIAPSTANTGVINKSKGTLKLLIKEPIVDY